jgi:hypothetical protein
MQATVWKRPVTACKSLAANRGRTAAAGAPPATAASYRRAASSACGHRQHPCLSCSAPSRPQHSDSAELAPAWQSRCSAPAVCNITMQALLPAAVLGYSSMIGLDPDRQRMQTPAA